jgi:Flp pilus assembly protein TadG
VATHPTSARRPRRGATSVELALWLPLLCLLFVVAVDFSRVFYFSVVVMNCARNGAVYGSADPAHAQDTAGIQSAAQADAANLTLSKLTVSAATSGGTSPTSVTVTASYPFTTITRYPLVPSSITLTRRVQMSVAPLVPNAPAN